MLTTPVYYIFVRIIDFFSLSLFPVSITRVERRSVLADILGYASQAYGTDLAIGFDPNQEEIDFSLNEEVIFYI